MKISEERLYELKNQVLMAEALNKEELVPTMEEGIQRYMGKWTPKFGYKWDIVLNEVYPIVQANLPATFFRNPRFFLKPRNKTYICKVFDPLTQKKVEMQKDSQKSANTQEAILNYSLYRMRYKNEVRKCVLDALIFPYAILWHGYKGEYGMTEEQSLYIKNGEVFVRRICPSRFLKDPNVNMSNLDESKWVGRIIDIPYMDLIEDDKLDVDKRFKGFKGYGDRVGSASARKNANAIPGGQDVLRPSPVLKKSLLDFADDGFKESKYSRFVRCYELYVRPTKKEKREGKKGYILLMNMEQDKPLRVNEWTVKAEGFPSKILQFNELNDSQFGMSDVDTYKDIADQKNVIVNLQLRNAQENSKLFVSLAKGGVEEEDLERVQQGDQTIVLFDGDTIQNKMSVQSGAGGASSELYLIDQRIQKNLDDKSGVTDLRRGVLQSGEESALSVKMRAAATSARPAYRQDLMSDFLKDSGLYINDLNRQFIPYDDAVRIIGSMDLQWSEKPTEEEIQADVDIELDVYSMLPENPEQELVNLNNILMLMIQGLTQPAIMQKLAQEGKMIELSPIIEQILMRSKIRNPSIFRNIKPEESQGFVAVEQLREAKQNVDAALTGQQLPFPPNPKDDHLAKIEIYTTIQQLLAKAQQESEVLNQLIEIQGQLLAEMQEKEAQAEQKVDLKKFKAEASYS